MLGTNRLAYRLVSSTNKTGPGPVDGSDGFSIGGVEVEPSPAPAVAPFIGMSKTTEGATTGIPMLVDMSKGMLLLRRRLNILRQEMAVRGHSEIFVSIASTVS
jgi:hypothetical protein